MIKKIILFSILNLIIVGCIKESNESNQKNETIENNANKLFNSLEDILELDSKGRKIVKTFSQFSNHHHEFEFPLSINQEIFSYLSNIGHSEDEYVIDRELIMNDNFLKLFERSMKRFYSDKFNLIKYFHGDKKYNLSNKDAYLFYPLYWFNADEFGINTFLSYIFLYRVETYEGSFDFILMANIETNTNEILNCLVLGISIGTEVGAPYYIELNSKLEKSEGNMFYVQQTYSIDSLGVPKYFEYPNEPGAPKVQNYISLQKKELFFQVFKDAAHFMDEE